MNNEEKVTLNDFLDRVIHVKVVCKTCGDEKQTFLDKNVEKSETPFAQSYREIGYVEMVCEQCKEESSE